MKKYYFTCSLYGLTIYCSTLKEAKNKAKKDEAIFLNGKIVAWGNSNINTVQ